MGKTMGNILVSMCGRRSTSYENELLTWAKTEYGNDWRFAYQHMLDNHGKAPKMGIFK
jgi:hypothetical protein